MKNDYQEIDNLIIEALTSEEAKYFKELEEQSLHEQVFGLFKGKLGWVTILYSILMVPIFAFAVYAGIKFFSSSDAVEMLRWGAMMFLGLMMTGFLKIFSWNQLDKKAILREMKRLEFQISLLSKEK